LSVIKRFHDNISFQGEISLFVLKKNCLITAIVVEIM